MPRGCYKRDPNKYPIKQTKKQKSIHNKNLIGRKLPMGTDHKLSKLNWEKVEYIKKSSLTQRKLAALFHVHQHTIWAVLNEKNWTGKQVDPKYNPKEK